MTAIERIFAILAGPGNDQWYDGDERVSQLDHALQCATLAEREGAPASLISAALLHDIGHLSNLAARSAVDSGVDARHEEIGVAVLEPWFGPAVLEPIRLHVAAKRYLTRIDPYYLHQLSWGSVRSLEVQGGSMSEQDAAAFIAAPFAADAVRLRRWDDLAKMKGLATPPLEHFRPYLQQALRTDID